MGRKVCLKSGGRGTENTWSFCSTKKIKEVFGTRTLKKKSVSLKERFRGDWGKEEGGRGEGFG